MAEEQSPEPLWKRRDEEWGDDHLGRELAASIRANEALLTGLTYEYGQKMVRAQAGEDDFPSPIELAQLKKLERDLQNDKAFLEARTITRRRSRRTSDVADAV